MSFLQIFRRVVKMRVSFKRLFLLFAVWSLVSCGSVNKIIRSDNTRVEVRTETVLLKDIVYVELPVIVEKVQTLDAVSMLENRFAKSEAAVSGGKLAAEVVGG